VVMKLMLRMDMEKIFLFPKVRLLQRRLKILNSLIIKKSIIQGRLKKVKIAAEAQAQEIEKVTCLFKKKSGENGKIFGAVTAQEISEKLRGYGIELDRRKLQLKEPIKSLGDFNVSVKLHPEVIASVKITVAQDEVAVVEPTEPPESAKKETAS